MPEHPVEGWDQALIEACRDARTVVDASVQPALWGRWLGEEATVLAVGSPGYARAGTARGAAELVQANLIELACSLRRECVDFYCLPITGPTAFELLDGAFQALEDARADGLVRFLGLSADAPPEEVLHLWSQRDAFEIVLLPTPDPQLVEFAAARRTAIVHRCASLHDLPAAPREQAKLVTVRSARDVAELQGTASPAS